MLVLSVGLPFPFRLYHAYTVRIELQLINNATYEIRMQNCQQSNMSSQPCLCRERLLSSLNSYWRAVSHQLLGYGTDSIQWLTYVHVHPMNCRYHGRCDARPIVRFPVTASHLLHYGHYQTTLQCDRGTCWWTTSLPVESLLEVELPITL